MAGMPEISPLASFANVTPILHCNLLINKAAIWKRKRLNQTKMKTRKKQEKTNTFTFVLQHFLLSPRDHSFEVEISRIMNLKKKFCVISIR